MADETRHEVNRCDLVAAPAAGSRAHDLYCHWLPRGHSGRCEPFPAADRLAREWHAAYVTVSGLDATYIGKRRNR